MRNWVSRLPATSTFVAGLYRYQMKRGKYLIHEHPWSARRETIDGIEELKDDPEVSVA